VIRVLEETCAVYRSEVGRRARFVKKAAYRDAAWQAWKAKYPCTCEHETDFVCSEHVHDGNLEEEPERWTYRRVVILRLARWLMWRDRRYIQALEEAVPR
jgi:hypothetical protein